jgi:glycosyltransferase involved in cell wall biosynthesis
MKILMFGWEYPPFITGGLGTACEGLTQALASEGADIDFVLPHRTGQERVQHMRLYSIEEFQALVGKNDLNGDELSRVALDRFLGRSGIGALFSSYARPIRAKVLSKELARYGGVDWLAGEGAAEAMKQILAEGAGKGDQYHDFLFSEVRRYAMNAFQAVQTLQTSRVAQYDVVHAHDWMTFPAGVIICKELGIPLVVHVHSLESDRTGDDGNPLITAIENLGAHNADRVIAVSSYTKRKIHDKLKIPLTKITVAHNGVNHPSAETQPSVPRTTHPRKRILFLGRVTFQKGPDKFVETAALVLKHQKNVTFVLAGAGDLLEPCRARVRELGVESHFEFPGFLRGKKLEEEFSKADLYVMPSISEPFGITALEAVTRGSPTLLSKQSGVSEVLRHALKCDFWDVRKMADYMINVLLHPELSHSLILMSQTEASRLSWKNTAKEVIKVYRQLQPKKRNLEKT